jgi:hypothetical protein
MIRMDEKFDNMTLAIYKVLGVHAVFEKNGEIWDAYDVSNGDTVATYNPKTDSLELAPGYRMEEW